MNESKAFGLTNFRHSNWLGDVPVAILNEASSMHDRIAFCWAAAEHLRAIAGQFTLSSNEDVSEVGSIFLSELEPLTSLLNRLGEDTRPVNCQGGGCAP